MFKNVLRLKGISEDLLYFLKGIVEGCISYIEKGALVFERYLGDFKDVKKITDDKELLRLLKYRLSYIAKLRHHFYLYECNYNSNVSDLVGLEFNNRFFENIHFLDCENFKNEPTEDDCMCFNGCYQAVVKDVSNFVNKRYDVIIDLEDAYKDLKYDCEERLEEQEELEEKELNKQEEVKIIEV